MCQKAFQRSLRRLHSISAFSSSTKCLPFPEPWIGTFRVLVIDTFWLNFDKYNVRDGHQAVGNNSNKDIGRLAYCLPEANPVAVYAYFLTHFAFAGSGLSNREALYTKRRNYSHKLAAIVAASSSIYAPDLIAVLIDSTYLGLFREACLLPYCS